jgi:hypothetical protein
LRDGGRGAAFGEMATETDVLSISENWLLKAKKGASMEGKKITNVATPSATTDAANKSYVDSAILAEFEKLFNERIIIGANDPESVLATAKNKAIFFKHK